MRAIKTLGDAIHAATNSLSLVSSHSQHLLGKLERGTPGREELEIIYEQAERAASLLGLVPRGLARTPIQDPGAADSRPGTARTDPRGGRHGKGRR